MDNKEMNVYKIKKGFLLRRMGGSAVVVAVGETAKAFKGVIKLNEVGAFLWELLTVGATNEQLLAEVTSHYDVEEEQAKIHIERFLQQLKEGDVLA